jgi:Uma2 family endonuclease
VGTVKYAQKERVDMAISTQSPDVVDGVYYPSSDGEPMAETDIHVLAIILLFEGLRDALRGRPLHYVAADIFWYWEQGNPRARCAPDIMVVRGVVDRLRRSFRSWQENNAVPSVVFEISSEETWQNDLEGKRELYARLGVREYFLFDPEALYLDPPLRGFRLDAGASVEIQLDADGSLVCQELGLRLIREGQMVRLINLATGTPIPTKDERAEQERQRAEQERLAREKAEAEVERLKQQLARLTQQKNGGVAPQ